MNRKRRAIILYFYPRSPCGERLFVFWTALSRPLFLSTLSLRRATQSVPRSHPATPISIHALLAESDDLQVHRAALVIIFLSTLSLRRATMHNRDVMLLCFDFYPRSPCGERLGAKRRPCMGRISIHALLAESDFAYTQS